MFLCVGTRPGQRREIVLLPLYCCPGHLGPFMVTLAQFSTNFLSTPHIPRSDHIAWAKGFILLTICNLHDQMAFYPIHPFCLSTWNSQTNNNALLVQCHCLILFPLFPFYVCLPFLVPVVLYFHVPTLFTSPQWKNNDSYSAANFVFTSPRWILIDIYVIPSSLSCKLLNSH